MLLAFDVGNTTIAIGLFRGRKLVKSWKIRTDNDKTSDDYGAISQPDAFAVSRPKDHRAIISVVRR
jgi:pantothenate kinase type III